MTFRYSRAAAIILIALLLSSAGRMPLPADAKADPDAGKVVVYRDEWGVPHIYAPTVEGGVYAMGYCQAEDRLEELLKNYLRAMGEVSSVNGPAEFLGDLQARIWRHYEVAQKNFGRIRPEVRRHLQLFVRGIEDYMAAHRQEVPAWWGDRKVDVNMAVAHSRQFMWGWPVGQALGELQRAGITPSLSVDMRSSNEMAIAAARTTLKAPILIIDPHLSWWGAQRFWEFRVHAGDLHGSGFTLPGSPYVGLGHNDNVAWAMTTGGPDTADIYALKLNPANPLQYKYDDSWRDLIPRKITITVKGEDKPRELTIYESHFGPVVARKGTLAYAAKLAYAEEVQFGEAFYSFNMARNIAEFRRGLELNQTMPQNVMVADTGGNIYYQRAGRVPVRPEGYDFSKPVDGSTSKSEWLGIHPASDLISVENPPQGYMQNCNVPPDVMMVGSPMTPDKNKPYLFNEASGRIHQRGARAVQLLQENSMVSPEKAMAIALDEYCLQYDRWTGALKKADSMYGQSFREDPDYQAGLRDILSWDGYSHSDSRGALKYYYWRRAVRSALGSSYAVLVTNLADYMAALAKPKREATDASEAELKALAEGFSAAMKTMRSNHKSIDASYGEVFRVGRGDRSWPVGGGSLVEEGMATLRAVGFEAPRPDFTRWGMSGQTSTQVVVLTQPVQSWTQPPIGESDRPDSAHYTDQAEKLFSRHKMKPTWYRKEELLKHVSSRTELKFPGDPGQ
jgi:acyl-homoserine lactone acylase PvdQ